MRAVRAVVGSREGRSLMAERAHTVPGGSDSLTLEWVNHASFIVEHGPIRLICDPWLGGTAFDHGWKHIVPTRFTHADFASITHIWMSHEHPDHFAPRDLKAIPTDIRARITMLYHSGVDHRIGAFCRNAGFKEVHELRPGEWLPLSDEVRVRSEDAGSGDSWLAVRTPTQTLLNVNDSVLERRGEFSASAAWWGRRSTSC